MHTCRLKAGFPTQLFAKIEGGVKYIKKFDNLHRRQVTCQSILCL